MDRAAHPDDLTGLPTRPWFSERLAELAAGQTTGEGRLALLCIDVDRLRIVNAASGYAAGDAVLRVLARRLQSIAGQDDVLARMGGDEFCILMPSAGREEACLMAAAALECVRAPIALEGRSLTATASIGIVLASEREAFALLHSAEAALARAKAEGGGRFRILAPEEDKAILGRHRQEFELRGALARSEFTLVYQPIVHVSSGEVFAHEALLRWKLPGHGEVDTESFIPIAEQTGLILPIGEWVLTRACADAARLPGDLPIAVNISTVQLADSAFETCLHGILAASNLPSERLVLEVTETALMNPQIDLYGVLGRIRGAGCRIALDDFGSGYSPFEHLRRFRFDAIKLDRAFGAGIAEPTTAAIVDSLLSLGRRLDIRVIVEGVETACQAEALRRAGCVYAQGHYYGAPRLIEMHTGQE